MSKLRKIAVENEKDLRQQFKKLHEDRIPGRNMADGGRVSFWRGLRDAFGPGEHPFQRESVANPRPPLTTGMLPGGRIREAGQALRERNIRMQEEIDGMANGGKVRPYSDGRDGGRVDGPGGPTDDKVRNVNLSDDEYVLPADTAETIGYDVLDDVVDATHTPVKKKGLRGMANGGRAKDPSLWTTRPQRGPTVPVGNYTVADATPADWARAGGDVRTSASNTPPRAIPTPQPLPPNTGIEVGEATQRDYDRAQRRTGGAAPRSTPNQASGGLLRRGLGGAFRLATGPVGVGVTSMMPGVAGAGSDVIPEGATPFEGLRFDGNPAAQLGTSGVAPPLEISVDQSSGQETNVPGIYRREGEGGVPEFFNLGPEGQIPSPLRGGSITTVPSQFFTGRDSRLEGDVHRARMAALDRGERLPQSGPETFQQRMARLDSEMGSRRIMSRGGMPNRLRAALEMENMRQQGQQTAGDRSFMQALALEGMRQEGAEALERLRQAARNPTDNSQRQIVQDTFDYIDQFFPEDQAPTLKRIIAGSGDELADMPPQERAAYARAVNQIIDRFNETRGSGGMRASALRGDPDRPGYQPVNWNPIEYLTEERLPGISRFQNWNLRANPFYGLFSGGAPRGGYYVQTPDGSQQFMPAPKPDDADVQMVLDRLYEDNRGLRR